MQQERTFSTSDEESLMKRTSVAVLMITLAIMALAAPAFAQAPAPKVTINGLIDNLTSYSRNVSVYDGITNLNDIQWYARTRGRFDIIGEVGKAKAVLGLELDHTYGQTGNNGSSINNAGLGTGTTSAATAFGTDGGFPLNTDSRGILEIKWLYVEFPVPLIPVPSTARLGAQPFGNDSSYKLCVYTCSDFAGANVTTQITPNIKTYMTFVDFQQSLTGVQANTTQGGGHNAAGTSFLGVGGTAFALGTASCTVAGNPGACAGNNGASANVQNRGNDFATIFSVEVTPFKGLNLKPMFSWMQASGTTDGNARSTRGGIVAGGSSGSGGGNPAAISAFNNFDGTARGGIVENRYTVGLDSQVRLGPLSIDPTFMYQWGVRPTIAQSAFSPGTGAAGADNTVAGYLTQSGAVPGRRYMSSESAFLFDMREGYQLGPLLLEALQVYSTGNTSRNNQLGTVRSFQPLTTDTGYLADWGTQLTSLGLDYLNAFNEAGARMAYPGVSIGWDKYGRGQLGVKATYAVTPALSIMGTVNAHWTAEAVNRNSEAVIGGGVIPVQNMNNVGQFGSAKHCGSGLNACMSNFLGTEFATEVRWRFADGLEWANGAGYMIAGPAMDVMTDPQWNPRNSRDIFMMTSRVRFTF